MNIILRRDGADVEWADGISLNKVHNVSSALVFAAQRILTTLNRHSAPVGRST